MFNFWCECVQCLRGGVRFPNEVGVWWPSVYGEPNPKALHFQPWVGLGLLDRQALHYPHGSLAVRLKHKKNLPDAGGTVIKEAVLSRRGPFIALRLG